MTLGHSVYITFRIIMPFRKLILPFTLTGNQADERNNVGHAISCAISRQEKRVLHKCIARFITYSSPRWADTWFPSLPRKECTGVRYVITKFSWMAIVYQIFLPMVLRYKHNTRSIVEN